MVCSFFMINLLSAGLIFLLCPSAFLWPAQLRRSWSRCAFFRRFFLRLWPDNPSLPAGYHRPGTASASDPAAAMLDITQVCLRNTQFRGAFSLWNRQLQPHDPDPGADLFIIDAVIKCFSAHLLFSFRCIFSQNLFYTIGNGFLSGGCGLGSQLLLALFVFYHFTGFWFRASAKAEGSADICCLLTAADRKTHAQKYVFIRVVERPAAIALSPL